MSDFINKSQSTFNRIENGKIKLDIELVPKIAKAMQLNEEDVLRALSGNTITTTNSENAQNNQNLVINLGTSEAIITLLEENNKIIKLLSAQLVASNAKKNDLL